MKNFKIRTINISYVEIDLIDFLVSLNYFESRSQAIRKFIDDFIYEESKRQEKIKEVMKLANTYS